MNGEDAAPKAETPEEPKKLAIELRIDKATGAVAIACNCDPVVMTVKDLTSFVNHVVQQMRPKEARRIIVP